MYYSSLYQSPIGELTLACDQDGKHLVGLWVKGQKYFGASLPQPPVQRDDIPLFHQVRAWLDSYFAGKQPAQAGLPLAPLGGAFRREVWRILLEIPYGAVITYGEIAARIARESGKEHMSAQAVGNAVGHNPISLIIPCHRIDRKSVV